MYSNSISITQLQSIAELIPSPIYWLDSNHKILGANELTAKAIGANCVEDMLGKTPNDFQSMEFAEPIIRHNEEVMLQERTLVQDETIRDLKTGKLRCFTVSKSPLHDEQGQVIGVVGISVEITAQRNAETLKMETLKKSNVLKYLDLIADSFPVPVYWVDLNSAALGGNQRVLEAIGLANYESGLGRTPFDLYPPEIAERIVKHNEAVIESGAMMRQLESIVDNSTGEVKHFNAYKAPLRDEDGKIIGVLGTSIDVTAEKDAEKIRLENETFKAAAEEQEKFRIVANKVAHDIRSPLSSMLMILRACDELPETPRIALRNAVTRINDIANNLLSAYAKIDLNLNDVNGDEVREPMLISSVLLQLLTSKKYQFQNLPVKFEHHFSQTGNFTWINVQSSDFQRAVSNIINNSVDAFDEKQGQITVHLDADEFEVSIAVEDDGKGMSPELVQKILQQIAVTEGKKDGHGIGMIQVCDMLKNNDGRLEIESAVGIGTKISLTFPRVAAQNWIADRMILNEDDTVVILDDDNSIHDAWDTRFNRMLKEYPLVIRHFEMGEKAIAFINGLSAAEKQKVFLLTDYELLKQDVHGIDVIRQTAVRRSILVTSHYADKSVRQDAIAAGTKILPKQLAYDIPIRVKSPSNIDKSDQVYAVFVDDDQGILDGLNFVYGKSHKIKTHINPQNFIDTLSQYSKDVKIFLDYEFGNFHLNGIEIALQLHDRGYTCLYLMTGMNLSKSDVPQYLTVIHKLDQERLQMALDE